MAYSFSTSVGDAVTTVFAFTFTGLDKGYLNKSDVHVELVDEQGVWTEVQYNTGWIFETTNSIRFLQTPPPVNIKFPHNIRIRRIMDKSSPYADWAVGQNFDEQTLDNSFLKLLYIEHELLDGFGMRDATGSLNMHGYRITDMAAGINDNDAVTLKQVMDLFEVFDAQGIVPIEQPRQFALTGVSRYDTPATKRALPSSFFVFVDAIRQKPVTDYTTDTIGKIDFIGSLPVGAKIDVVYFEPKNYETDISSLYVTSTGSTTPRKLEDRFAERINVLDYGADNTGVKDSRAAILSALSKNKNVYFPKGVYRCIGSINWPEGIIIFGDNSETYGEFYRSKSLSTIQFESVTGYAMEVNSGARPIYIKDMNFLGNWTFNGLRFDGSNREVTLINVSMKRFIDGMYSDNCWVSTFERISIAATGTGIKHTSGTTTKFDRVEIQGNKESAGGAKCAIGFDLGDPTKFLHSTIIQNSAIQHAEIATNITGNTSVTFESCDIEDIGKSLFRWTDTLNSSTIIDNCYLGATDITVEGIFSFRGTISKDTHIDMRGCNALNRFFNDDWRSVNFIDSNATYTSGCSFLVPKRWVAAGSLAHLSTTAPLVQNFIRIKDDKQGTTLDGLLFTGATSYAVPSGYITNLYNDALYFNPITEQIVIPNDVGTGISYLFKMCSTHYTVGSLYPEIAYFTLRRVSGDTAFEYRPLSLTTGEPVHITMTYDSTTDVVTIGTESATQEVIISRA